jgi:hypothetical protein
MGTLESLPSGTGTRLQGEKPLFSFKKCKGNSVIMNQKNPGYSVSVHCNIVIVETNIVGEVVKGNKKFSQSINQSK